MGLEAKTSMQAEGRRTDGKLHLDSHELSFQAPGLKWAVALGPNVRAESTGGILRVSGEAGEACFDLGDQADKWVSKILNPPTLLKKLGVRADSICWVSPGFSTEFRNQLKEHGARITRSAAKSELAFLKLTHRRDLPKLQKVVADLATGTNIWVVWPKGADAIRQADVLQAAKDLGMGPSKTAAFASDLSSMRFAQKS